MQNHHDIFISYARADDEPFIERLYKDLDEHGHKVWWDREAMESRGQTFLQVIRDAIAAVERVILVVGPEAVASDYVAVEWQYALEVCTPVVPILRLGEYDQLPEELSGYHCPEFREGTHPYEESLSELLRILKEPVQTGALHSVPALPAHFLPRPESIAAIHSTVLTDSDEPTIITGTKYATALHGMGGVGKSVMAAAFARRCETRWAFDDGVVWLTFGQNPNLVNILKGMGQFFGDDLDHYINETTAKARIVDLLSDKNSLLVLDDIWEMQYAESFINALSGTRCRTLITTRNNGLARDLDAQEHRLDELDDPQALALLADWAEQDVETLPKEAADIAQECGNLPLALAIAGAMVKGKLDRWKNVLHRLQNADLEKLRRQFPNYPYTSLLAAIQVSVDMLEPHIRQRYLDFAVFPEDTPIPEKVLATLWAANGLDEFDTQDVIDELANRSLLQQDEDGQITLHDLQHDYLRAQANDLLGLHRQFIESYAVTLHAPRSTLHETPWHKLPPEEPYIWQYLAYHHIQAKEWESLYHLLTDFDFLEAKCRAMSVYDMEADYRLALEDWRGDTNQKAVLDAFEERLRLESHHFHKAPELLFHALFNHLTWLDAEADNDGVLHTLCNEVKNGRVAWLRSTQDPRREDPLWLRSFEGHTGSVHSVAVTTDDGQLVSGAGTTVKVWDLESGRLLRSLEGHTNWVNAVAVMPDSAQVVSGSSDNTVKVWDLGSGRLLRSLEGHTNEVNAVAVTPDGKQVVSGSSDNTVKVWDLGSGRLLRSLEGHTDEVNAVAVTPDGAQVVSGSDDKTVKVWDLGSGRLLRSLKGHTSDVNAVAVTPDGAQVVSGSGSLPRSSDNTVKVWDLGSGRLLRSLEGHTRGVTAVAVTPDGAQVVSGSNDKTVKVWDLESGRLLRSLEEHTKWVNTVALTPDSAQVVSGSSDNTVKVWDLESGRLLRSLEGHTNWVNAVAVTPDGKQVVSGSKDNTVKVWDLESGRLLRSLEGHTNRVQSVAVTPDGKQVVSGSYDNNLKVWDLGSGRPLRSLKGHASVVYSVAVTPDGKQVVSGSYDKTIKVWDLESGRLLRSLEGHTNWVNAVAVTPDGKQVVSGSKDKTVKVWDLGSGRLLRSLEGHKIEVNTVAVTPDGEQVVSGSSDNTLKVWDLGNGRLLRSLEGHTRGVTAVAVMPDGKQVVSGSKDKTVKVWDLGSGRLLRSLEGHTNEVTAVAMTTPDGNQVVSGSNDKTVKVWDLGSGRLLRSLEGYTWGVTVVAVTPDGKQVISGSKDKTIKVWDLGSWRLLRSLEGHTDEVNAVAVTPDGKQVVSGSDDNTVKVWDLGSGRLLRSLEGHTDEVNAVAVTPDGAQVVSGSDDKTVKVWDIRTGEYQVLFWNDCAISSLALSQDGRWVIVGDAQGRVWIFEWMK